MNSATISAVPANQLRREQPGDHGLGQIAGDQGGDGNADLGAGQLERQRAVCPLDHRVAWAAGSGVGVHRAAFQRGQGELGGDEDRGADGEQREKQQTQHHGQGAHRCSIAGSDIWGFMLAVHPGGPGGPGAHQPVGSGWPSAKPAADCTPSTARSCSSASVLAPT
jgi:hypothetical protein